VMARVSGAGEGPQRERLLSLEQDVEGVGVDRLESVGMAD
jgi:hypothetical protein